MNERKMDEKIIQLVNVSKVFDETTAVENVSFYVRKGEFITFLGPSGCGKTTLLKMINRLIDPTAGQILINGTDIIAQDPIELRRNMGYVIQQTGLFVHMTVRENIELGNGGRHISDEKIFEKKKNDLRS